jgi:sulfatase modifying factor 1
LSFGNENSQILTGQNFYVGVGAYPSLGIMLLCVKYHFRMNRLFTFVILVGLLACKNEKREKESTVAENSVGDGMVLIPAGTFMMGGKSDEADWNEFPRNEVTLSSFYMDANEVTNAEFKKFVDATKYITVAERDIDWEVMKKDVPPGTPKPADSILMAGAIVFKGTDGPVNLQDYTQWWQWTIGANWLQPEGPGSSIEGRMNHPVVQVSWEDAKAYSTWAGKRLPTEAEWEWAAMGGTKEAKYPWGNEPIEEAYSKANFYQGSFPFLNSLLDGFETTAPVGSYAPNGYGLFDMAGNVWEWCEDKYHVGAYTQLSEMKERVNPKGPNSAYDPQEPYADKYVIRGGSFLCNDSYCSGYRTARRMSSTKDSGFNHTGFRCVKDVKSN